MLRSKPLHRLTRLKLKRDTPRRNKRVTKPGKSSILRAFHGLVATMPCVACGRKPVEVHHVVSDGFSRLSKDHRRVLPVCSVCHRTGREAIHAIGHGPWNELNGIDQMARAQALWEAFL